MSRHNKELNILTNLFNKLSEEEKEELLEAVNNNSKQQTKTNKSKKDTINHFNEEELIADENKKHREISKKLNQSVAKRSARQEVNFIKVYCKNCGKEYSLPENYPNIKNFICCI